jgi:hypothetical protein
LDPRCKFKVSGFFDFQSGGSALGAKVDVEGTGVNSVEAVEFFRVHQVVSMDVVPIIFDSGNIRGDYVLEIGST